MRGSADLPPWLDLPDPVTELILEHLPLPDYIRFAAVCQKWGSIQKDHRLRHSPRPPPMATNPLPWLIPRILSLGKRFNCYSPLEKRPHRLQSPTTPTFPRNTICMASFRGWLLMLDKAYDLDPFNFNPTLSFSRRPFLFNPLTGAMISLPMLSIVPGDEQFGALSSPPYDPDCTILLVSRAVVTDVFLCRLNDPGGGWIMGVQIEKLIDSAVYHGGKFYCISRDGVFYIIDHVCSTPGLLRLTMDVSALYIRHENRCRLVEFGGELLLVMEMYDWLNRRHEGFQVFRADLSGGKWVEKMDVLADHVLFLDERCSFSLLASDVGCKKNCIYCADGLSNHVWMVFDLDTRNWIHKKTISRGRFSSKFCSGCWFLPTLG